MMKGLMDCCLCQEMTLNCLKAKAKAMEAKLGELKSWKVVQENKFDLMKKLLEESKALMEELKKVLKDKEDEISKFKKQLCHAKEDAIKEYRDSDALLSKLGSSFADDFDDCLCQVKASFLNLDLSHITIDSEGQTLARPVASNRNDELFAINPNPNP